MYCQKSYENENTEGTEKSSVVSKKYLVQSGTQELRNCYPYKFLCFTVTFLQFMYCGAVTQEWNKKTREKQNNNAEGTEITSWKS